MAHKFRFLVGNVIPRYDENYWINRYEIHKESSAAEFLSPDGFGECVNWLESRCSNGDPIHAFVSYPDKSLLLSKFSHHHFFFSQSKELVLFGIPVIPHPDLEQGDVLFLRTSVSVERFKGCLREFVVKNCGRNEVCLWRDE